MLLAIYINGNLYTENRIYNCYFKSRLNQVGRFEFDAALLTDTEIADDVKESSIVIIKVNTVTRFEGFIKKVQYNKSALTWHVEGEGLGGILGLKRTQDPVVMEMNASNFNVTYTKYVAAEVIFNQCGFPTSGTNGWQVSGVNGMNHFSYYIENRTAIDHVIQLAKTANLDWRCYLA